MLKSASKIYKRIHYMPLRQDHICQCRIRKISANGQKQNRYHNNTRHHFFALFSLFSHNSPHFCAAFLYKKQHFVFTTLCQATRRHKLLSQADIRNPLRYLFKPSSCYRSFSAGAYTPTETSKSPLPHLYLQY